MGRAEDIYDRILREGVDAVHGFVRDRESESLFLDFKRSRDGGKDGKLHDHDRNSLAKAISGFGNSEGGVIVWGVECSKKDKGDVASELIPIGDVKRFVSLLEGAVSGCTLPPCPRVENCLITTGSEDSGFVVTYVPKSNAAPHQVVNDYRYYVRTGSSFSPVLHGVLAGMFGRRPQSNVSATFASHAARNCDGAVCFNLIISVYNDGPGIAFDPYFNMSFLSFPSSDVVEFSYEARDIVNWSVVEIGSRCVYAMSKEGFRLAPNSEYPLFEFSFIVLNSVERDIKIKFQCGSSNGSNRHFFIESSVGDMNMRYNEFFELERYGALDAKYLSCWCERYLNMNKVKESLKHG